jgi:hypothetical protein
MTGNAETSGKEPLRSEMPETGQRRKGTRRLSMQNDRANDIPSTTPTGSALASSFTTEVSTPVAATSLSVTPKSQSQESLIMQINASYASETAHQESETSTDELAIDVNPPAKRSSRSRQSHHQKSNTRAIQRLAKQYSCGNLANQTVAMG